MHFPIGKVVDRNKWLIVALLFAAINFVLISHAAAQTLVPSTPDPSLETAVNTTVDTMQTLSTSIANFLMRLSVSPESNVTRLLMIVIGIVLLVAGWRVYEYVIIIAGAIIGASVASSMVETNAVAVNLIVLLVGGLVGAVLSMFLYYVAVFLIGSHLGIVLTSGLASALSLQPVTSLVLLIGGIIGGLVLLGLSFEFLIVLSALVGGHILSLGLGLSPVWTLLFALVGIVVQYSLTRVYHYDFRRRWDYRTRNRVYS